MLYNSFNKSLMKSHCLGLTLFQDVRAPKRAKKIIYRKFTERPQKVLDVRCKGFFYFPKENQRDIIEKL